MARTSLIALFHFLVSGLIAGTASAAGPYGQPVGYLQPGQPPVAPMQMPQQAIRQYPQFNAPLYPCPRQDIPAQVGGTMYTNQAFAPHELLYEHEYRGIYAPYYYKVKGSWLWTPFGIESHDKWELMGTEVKVKYRSNHGLLSGFTAPFRP